MKIFLYVLINISKVTSVKYLNVTLIISATGDVEVKIAGIECKVKKLTDTQIECVTGMFVFRLTLYELEGGRAI